MTRLRLLSAITCAILLALPILAEAAPSGAIVRLYYQEGNDRRVVMAASDQGLVFLGPDLHAFRAFRSQAVSQAASGQPFVYIDDLDNDREDEFAFAGNPSFVLDTGADPYFGVLTGCDEFYVGNILDDASAELFCHNGTTINVWFYDGQFLWEYDVTDMNISGCVTDNLDGDEQIEFSCATDAGSILFDLGNDASPVSESINAVAEVSAGDPTDEWVAEAQRALSGETGFDLNGDGNDDEKLRWNAGTLNILSASGSTLGSASLSESELYSVAVGDLNSDGTPEIFVGGAGTVYVISPSGELLSQVSGNPGDLNRDTRVTIESAGANGLADSSNETTRAAVEGSMSSLQRCYDNVMGDNQFVRVGQMYYELSIDDRGHVTGKQRIHSSVNDPTLEECVENAFDDMRFSEASGGTGTVSVRLGFDFVDQ